MHSRHTPEFSQLDFTVYFLANVCRVHQQIAFREDDITTGAALYFLINELLICSDKHRAS
jgi:hypothetical protein